MSDLSNEAETSQLDSNPKPKNDAMDHAALLYVEGKYKECLTYLLHTVIAKHTDKTNNQPTNSHAQDDGKLHQPHNVERACVLCVKCYRELDLYTAALPQCVAVYTGVTLLPLPVVIELISLHYSMQDYHTCEQLYTQWTTHNHTQYNTQYNTLQELQAYVLIAQIGDSVDRYNTAECFVSGCTQFDDATRSELLQAIDNAQRITATPATLQMQDDGMDCTHDVVSIADGSSGANVGIHDATLGDSATLTITNNPAHVQDLVTRPDQLLYTQIRKFYDYLATFLPWLQHPSCKYYGLAILIMFAGTKYLQLPVFNIMSKYVNRIRR